MSAVPAKTENYISEIDVAISKSYNWLDRDDIWPLTFESYFSILDWCVSETINHKLIPTFHQVV